MQRERKIARWAAERIKEAGGRAFFVGGCVRDQYTGYECKDLDIEIYGISQEQLLEILQRLGPVDLVGKSFGVYKVAGVDVDFAFPRRERKNGEGHRAFQIRPDPFMDPKEACSRRDFTINAMMQDVLTGEVLDYYGGRKDLEEKRICHIRPASFQEDSLRVFRAAQFSARFQFAIAPQTLELCRQIPVNDLPGERVEGELKKVLLKAEKPSLFFQSLRQMDHLHEWFPEISHLVGVEQRPDAHPEGDVYTHTLMVLDQAALLRDKAHHPYDLMLAACTHDLGKAVTTQLRNGKIQSLGHEQAGIPLAQAMLSRLKVAGDIQKRVLNWTENHMRPGAMALSSSRESRTNLFLDRVEDPADLLLLAQADCKGRGLPVAFEKEQQFWRERMQVYNNIVKDNPFPTGKELLALGVPPGKHMGALLQQARNQILCGDRREIALRNAVRVYDRMKKESKEDE